MGKFVYRCCCIFFQILFRRRTVHSLVVLLSMFPNITLIYITPDGLELPEEIVEEVKERGIQKQVRLAQIFYKKLD